jgi:hypothetical protein
MVVIVAGQQNYRQKREVSTGVLSRNGRDPPF